jgi:hypothetical protein
VLVAAKARPHRVLFPLAQTLAISLHDTGAETKLPTDSGFRRNDGATAMLALPME